MSQITREVVLDSSVLPPSGESLLTMSETERAFLHKAVTADDGELRKKILEVQKLAYAEHPYPCIHAFHFVNLMMSDNPVYPEVIRAGQIGTTVFLDLGCCMGTDVRKLVDDGYPGSKVFGCDLRQTFIDAGYDLFHDAGTCKIHFFTSDIFDVQVTPPSGPPPVANFSSVTELKQLRGAIDHFYAGALFHLFNESTQHAIALRVASTLLNRKRGSVIFGRHQGLTQEGLLDDHVWGERYGHSPKSWEVLWKKVFTEVESEAFANDRVKVEATSDEGWRRDIFTASISAYMMQWSVRIL